MCNLNTHLSLSVGCVSSGAPRGQVHAIVPRIKPLVYIHLSSELDGSGREDGIVIGKQSCRLRKCEGHIFEIRSIQFRLENPGCAVDRAGQDQTTN